MVLTASADAGYTFDGWSGDLTSTENPDTVIVTDNQTITATFTQIPTYTLNIDTVGQGGVTLNPPGGVYETGTSVVLTASADAGYTFDGWSGDLTSTENPDTVIVTANQTITATFTEVPTFTLDIDTVGAGGVTLNPPGGIYESGTSVTITATPDAGHIFDAWSGDLTGNDNPDTITMNGNKNVTATFIEIPQYTITVNISGSGTVDLSPPGGTYDQGTAVTIAAVPDGGYQFSQWSGDLSGSTNPEAITMNSDQNITATFSEANQPIMLEEVVSGGSSSAIDVVTTQNITAAGGHLYLAAISSKPNRDIISVNGLGLTWSRVDAQCAGRNQTTAEIWMAIGTPTGDDVVSATFAAAPHNAVIISARYSGVDGTNPIGDVVSGNTNGLEGACSGGTDSDAYSFNMTTTASGSYIFGALAMRNRAHVGSADYTELHELAQGSGGSVASVAVVDRDVSGLSNITLHGTFNRAVDWSAIGVEIRQSGAPQLKFASTGAAGIVISDTRNDAFKGLQLSKNSNDAASEINSEILYLKFAIKGVRAESIAAVHLRLPAAAENTDNLHLYAVSNNYRGSRGEWHEADLHEGNAPSIESDQIATLSLAENGNWVTADISNFINGDGSYSFAVSGYENGAATFIHSDRPQIIVDTISDNRISTRTGSTEAIGAQLLELHQGAGEMLQTGGIPLTPELQGNYPNPFNGETIIRYALSSETRVKASVYNVRGQRISQLLDEVQSAGYKSLNWDATDIAGNELSSGIYFLHLNIGEQKFVRKMVLQK